MSTHDSLPDDVATLKRLVLARDAELAQARAEGAGARRRSRPHIQRGGRIPTAAVNRPARGDRSCRREDRGLRLPLCPVH
jgi:hypothetical protein